MTHKEDNILKKLRVPWITKDGFIGLPFRSALIGSRLSLMLCFRKNMMRVEDKYTDVLQNIEFGIVMTYRHHPELSDYSVMLPPEAESDNQTRKKGGQ